MIYHQKFIYADGAVREMVLWQLPVKSPERPHGMKYRLYYGRADGKGVVRYADESVKGDHRHFKGEEKPYTFIDKDKRPLGYRRSPAQPGRMIIYLGKLKSFAAKVHVIVREIRKNLRSKYGVECLGRGQNDQWRKTGQWQLGSTNELGNEIGT